MLPGKNAEHCIADYATIRIIPNEAKLFDLFITQKLSHRSSLWFVDRSPPSVGPLIQSAGVADAAVVDGISSPERRRCRSTVGTDSLVCRIQSWN